MKPHKCPVCDGTGLVNRPPWVAGDAPGWVSNQTTYKCNACGGGGVLWGPDDPKPQIWEWKNPYIPEQHDFNTKFMGQWPPTAYEFNSDKYKPAEGDRWACKLSA